LRVYCYDEQYVFINKKTLFMINTNWS
jgi:hypothetical protein